MKKRSIFVLIVLFAFGGALRAQERTITGNVRSGENGSALSGVYVVLKYSARGTFTGADGKFMIKVPGTGGTLIFSLTGYGTREVVLGPANHVEVRLSREGRQPIKDEVAEKLHGKPASPAKQLKKTDSSMGAMAMEPELGQQQVWNTEEYDAIHENMFHGALQNPLSTFSIDVDAASYSNVRRFIQNGQRPPVDAVRIEEMINYFDYHYGEPVGEDPLAIYTEISAAPWNAKHKLVHIGLRGRTVSTENLPASNLVFLLDVSGSMEAPNKLSLLKSSFRLLVEQLRPQDRVAIVVYAGAAGLVLPSTAGSDKKAILSALENLQAGGSTAGGAGIQLAYAVAKENFRQGGNNRIILATDGDFNIGESSNAGMERLIEQKRNDGIFLTVLGFGMGNYKDSKMEILADKGNGNYAYIDNILEAQKVLVKEFGGTLFTIAKDVKLQVEFNPANVQAYRLIGYENRMLRSEDFNNDKRDAGELGSGHTVTALYEIIPTGVESEFFQIDRLKYQQSKLSSEAGSKELMTIKIRYKKPEGDVSKLMVHAVNDSQVPLLKTSDDFRWSASVAAFGMLLRDSEYLKTFTYKEVFQLAQDSKGKDPDGYQAEFINLVKMMGLTAAR